MAKILMLTHRIPYPPNKGDKIRAWHILNHLSKSHDVHLGTFIDSPLDARWQQMVMKAATSSKFVRVYPVLQKLRGLLGLMFGRSATETAYPVSEMQRFVAEKQDEGIDAIYLYSCAMAQMLPKSAWKSPVIMDFVDADSLKWKAYGKNDWGIKAGLMALEGIRLAKFEEDVARKSAVNLFVSSREIEAFLKGRPGRHTLKPILSLENGVDTQFFSPYRLKTEKRRDSAASSNSTNTLKVIFTGAMDYLPNVSGVLWFAQTVWPAVKEKFKSAQFIIAGSPVSSQIFKLNGNNGILVTGPVDDMAKEIEKADVAIAPLFIARGVQNKVLEAMAMAKPVVATSDALTGLDSQISDYVCAANNENEFKESIFRLLKEKEYRQTLGGNARRYVVENYAWNNKLSVLDMIIEKHL